MKTLEFVIDELKNYVRKEEWAPYKAVIGGLVGVALFGVAGAIISLVIRK